ncbi:MAG: 5'-nucleotidase C-terminal domain-containing protein, partial [Deltaproteobacteria bacterium]|nr:5'-nucleotidase C-terminal domain-containing protein [Deltaproteobacteria bacterium]
MTVADVYELMPFGNTVFVLDLTGAELKAMLETVIARALNPDSTGAFPYLSSARFAADASLPVGQKVTEVQ